ncbi:hypothetical protein D3C84_1046900 [compost metagenome]
MHVGMMDIQQCSLVRRMSFHSVRTRFAARFAFYFSTLKKIFQAGQRKWYKLV